MKDRIHPALFSMPVMVVLVLAVMPLNGDFYLSWINSDPQGDAEMAEWIHATRLFRYTSGVLWGQLLAFAVGVLVTRRHRHAVALAVAGATAVLLAATTVAVAFPLAAAVHGTSIRADTDPLLIQVVSRELAAYPLYAAAGVGTGVLLGDRRPPHWVWWPLGTAWVVASITGMVQDDTFDAPIALLWTVPPVAAGATVGLAGLAIDVNREPVVVGDTGTVAGVALLAGAMVWALLVNLLGLLVRRRSPVRR
jgi:hypothetical protein